MSDMKNQDPHRELLQSLIDEGVLRTPEIIAAFGRIDRRNFVPSTALGDVYVDAPLAIGRGQTISQPTTVALMLEALQPKIGERVLDIGAGSGWTAALLGTMVGPTGQVTAVERHPDFAKMARQQLSSHGLHWVDYRVGDGSHGWSDQAPYDVIHVAAAARQLPDVLRQQLAAGGRLIIPVGHPIQDLVLITKIGHNRYTELRLPGFRFVPLIINP